MIGQSWTHRLARVFVRPLLGTRVRPNHLTTVRLVTGLTSCAMFAVGTTSAMHWGAVSWLVSAFLDRADGELARIGDMMSAAGHRYDYYTDNVINALFFVAAGVGLRHSWLGDTAIWLGFLSGASMFFCSLFAEWLELRSPAGSKAYSGRWGFDPDDALYLMAPLAWFGWLAPVLVGASVGTTVFMAITGLRLARLRRRQCESLTLLGLAQPRNDTADSDDDRQSTRPWRDALLLFDVRFDRTRFEHCAIFGERCPIDDYVHAGGDEQNANDRQWTHD